MFRSLLLLGALVLSSHADVQAPTGEHTANISDFYPKLSLSGNSSEEWYYSIILDNGSKIYVSFKLNKDNFAPEISVVGIGGNSSIGREFKRDAFTANRASQSMVADRGTNRFILKGMPGSGHHLTFVSDKGKGYDLELDFDNAIPSKVPNGAFKVNGTTFGQAILVPWSKVHGTIRIGNLNQNINGVAYVDHVWMTAGPKDFTSKAIQFLTYKPALSGRLFTAQNGGYFGYAVSVTDGQSKSILANSWKANGKLVNDDNNPTGVNSLTFGNYSMDFIRRDQQTYRPLDNIDNMFARQAVRLVMGNLQIYRGSSAVNNGAWLHYAITGF